MANIKSFAAPHKGLRNVISKFSVCIGHTDFQEPVQLLRLKELGRDMFTLLNDHVHTENEHTLRHLEERVKGASAHDREDHERLDGVQDALEQQLTGFTGEESPEVVHQFYLNFSRFHSQYLEHIYEEETVTELLLQQYFSDEELMGHRMEIMQSIEFPILRLWLKYTIPAQSENESLGMLAGFKASAPPAAFAAVLAVIKSEMEPDRFERLVMKVN